MYFFIPNHESIVLYAQVQDMAPMVGQASGSKDVTACYRPGVLIGNWQEDAAGTALQQTGKHMLGYGGNFTAATSTRTDFNDMGKTGEDLLASYNRLDLGRRDLCVSKEIKFPHGDPTAQPVAQATCSLNQLTYGEKVIGEPRVQQYLWCGKNKLDTAVPLSGPGGSAHQLTSSKQQIWVQEQERDMYATTSKDALFSAALAASSGK